MGQALSFVPGRSIMEHEVRHLLRELHKRGAHTPPGVRTAMMEVEARLRERDRERTAQEASREKDRERRLRREAALAKVKPAHGPFDGLRRALGID